ncbi:hypothetical protein BC830DRAFT_884884 [Chytriomyces sp. MP71]|nr:hypothetical protein BC830DRAFT_884884 [Chytriomyces sp. MP71]
MDRRLRILVERGQRTGVFRHACTVVNTSICSQYDGLHTAMSPRPPPSHSRPLQAPVSGNAHSLRLFVGANESVLDEADRIASFGRLTEIGFEPTTSCIHAVFREANACLAAKAHYNYTTCCCENSELPDARILRSIFRASGQHASKPCSSRLQRVRSKKSCTLRRNNDIFNSLSVPTRSTCTGLAP